MARGRRFAPLWVYLWALFAVAFVQVALVPPREHEAAFNVTVFAGLAALVVVVITLLERARR
ncbi:MAG: hypothetical protein ACRDZ2_10130 [Ilumatobacteraceae bacterium]